MKKYRFDDDEEADEALDAIAGWMDGDVNIDCDGRSVTVYKWDDWLLKFMARIDHKSGHPYLELWVAEG